MSELMEQCRIHGLHDGSLKEKLIAKAADEIERLERLCLDDDNYRCDGCERVFGVDDIVFGDDCELCVTCVKAISEAHA